jgi:hypothetical protein
VKAVQNRRTDLPVQLGLRRGRAIDAPKAPGSIPLERFEDESRGEATGNSGFDHIGRLQVTGKAPNRTQ